MTTLPDGLRQQFEALETRLWRTDTAIAVCGSALALFGAFALQLLSDRLWDTPAWLRALLFLSAIAVMLASLFYYGRRWIWGHRSIETMAAIVQKRYRRLGDRLLGIVELADASRRPANISEELCAAAIRQVADEAAKINFNEAVETRKSTRLKTALIITGLLLAAPWIIAPEACWSALSRLLQPTSPLARYTFVSLEQLPDQLVVAHGEPFEIAVGIAQSRLLNPGAAFARFERQPEIQAPVREGAARFQIPGQTSPGLLRLTVGDASREIFIEPVYRPELRELQATVELPSYLQYPPQTLQVKTSTLPLVEGSRAAFRGKINRPLSEIQSVRIAANEESPLETTLAGAEFETLSVAVRADEEPKLRFHWKDEHGLAPATPWSLSLTSKKDAPPDVTLSGMAAAVAMLETETLALTGETSDDFGIRDLSMAWQIERAPPAIPGQEIPSSGEERIARGEPQLRTAQGQWDFTPSRLGIRGDSVVLIQALARDYLPAREPATSGAYRVHVLGPDSHAKLIQDELDKILAKLDDIARLQEELLESGKQLEQLSPEELKDPANAKKLSDQAEAEKRLAEKLAQLAKETAQTLEEAMRNKEIDPKTLNQWAEHMSEMQSIASTGMPQAANQLSQAAKSPEERQKELEKALESEKKVLEALRELQKKAGETQDRMSQENIALRLRKLGDRHAEASATLTALLPDIAGLSSAELPEPSRGKVEALAGAQQKRHAEAAVLQKEITRFFNRTQMKNYGEVAQSMVDKAMDEKLLLLAQLIADNTTMTGIEQSQEWAKQFHLWADLIAANDSSKSEQQQGQPGEVDPEKLKVMFDLMRLRQREVALRERTEVLENNKEHNESYASGAAAAGKEQREIQEAATKIGQNPAFCPGPEAMKIATTAMDDAAKLLEVPSTGVPTIEAETDVINILDQLLQSQCKSAGMAAMAGMLGMGQGQGASGTGSMAGGDTSRSIEPVKGNVSGDRGTERSGERMTGLDPNRTPSEFREALQGYYQALEKVQAD